MLAILAFGGCRTRMFDGKCFLHMIRSVRSSAAKPRPSDAHGVPQLGFLTVKAYAIQLMMLGDFCFYAVSKTKAAHGLDLAFA